MDTENMNDKVHAIIYLRILESIYLRTWRIHIVYTYFCDREFLKQIVRYFGYFKVEMLLGIQLWIQLIGNHIHLRTQLLRKQILDAI